MTGLLDLLEPDSERRGTIFGVVTGVVTNNQDPEALGRVRIKFPWLSDTDESWWARVASPMAGDDNGVFLLPEVEDEVLVAFEHGDPRFPYVLGSLWNSKRPPFESNGDGKNNKRVIKSRSGHTIVLDDTDGEESISILDKSAKNTIVISTKDNSVTISSDADISIACPNGTLKMEAQAIEMKSSADLKLTAGANAVVKGTTIKLN